jgi:RimJ/RimL family protein N-acetyltransferase
MSQSIDPVLIDIPMPITTPRLRIEPVAPGHGTYIHEMKAETWDDLLVWMPWAYAERDNSTVDHTETIVRKSYAEFILRTDMTMIAFEVDSNRPVAMTGLHRFDWNTRSFEIGYWVRGSAQGRGYATEIANALTRFAFDQLQARRVGISHADGNDRSRRVIERLGYEHEAFRRNVFVMPDGRIMSYHDYVRFNTDNLPALDVRWQRRQ